jgi:fumarylpyruvate hydrolase
VLAPVAGTATLFPINRIFCVGRNYEAHAAEMGATVDREAPFFFTKGRDTYVPSGAVVAYPPQTNNYQFELELVIAIGAAGFRLALDQAPSVVFGYACGLDMTRRDLQLEARKKALPWDFGKDFESSAVLSQIVPVTLIGHPRQGKLELTVNGQVKQSGDISQLIHPVANLVSYLSSYYHLQPGDLIYTGTPQGVGPVVAGDQIEGSIERVGRISLRVSAGS